METIIVSRHPAAIAFIRESLPALASSPVVAEATRDDVRGKVVVGNIPLHLAVVAEAVIAVEFDGAPPRGAEYGVAEMRAAGARLAAYTVGLPTPFPACDCALAPSVEEAPGVLLRWNACLFPATPERVALVERRAAREAAHKALEPQRPPYGSGGCGTPAYDAWNERFQAWTSDAEQRRLRAVEDAEWAAIG